MYITRTDCTIKKNLVGLSSNYCKYITFRHEIRKIKETTGCKNNIVQKSLY